MHGVSRAGVAPKGTVTWVSRGRFPGLGIAHLPPCLPSLHRFMLPGFVATTKALTAGPANPAVSVALWGRLVSPQRFGFPGRLSLLIAFELLTVPPPTTAAPFRRVRFVPLRHRLGWPRRSSGQTQGVGRIAVTRSRVRHLRAVSPTGLAESSSLALRTGHSSQVALHLSSRKRSYHFRLQAGNDSLTGTLSLPFKRLHRRTRLSFRERTILSRRGCEFL
jgi:hypothetical protein